MKNQFNHSLSIDHRLWQEPQYNSMPVLQNSLPMMTDVLDALYKVINFSLCDYSRVHAFRCDLHIPLNGMAFINDDSNVCMSKFIASFKAKIAHNRSRARQQYDYVHDTEVRYLWVREIGPKDGRVHYHCVILLNGHAFHRLGNFDSPLDNTANRVFEAWASAWKMSPEAVRTLVTFPEHPSYMLERDDQASIDEFFQRASYLCKAWTKHSGFGHHLYGSSRG